MLTYSEKLFLVDSQIDSFIIWLTLELSSLFAVSTSEGLRLISWYKISFDPELVGLLLFGDGLGTFIEFSRDSTGASIDTRKKVNNTQDLE